MIDDFELDPDTGLPMLPPGLIWDIQELNISIRKRTPADPWRLAAWDPWEGKYSSILGFEYQYRCIIKNRKWGSKERTKIVAFCRAHSTTEMVFGWDFDTPTTTDNIIDRCWETLYQFAERQIRNALYGEYPPKRLEMNNG